jgi:hypothetical protein
MRQPRLLGLAAIVAGAALALTACGDDSDPETGDQETTASETPDTTQAETTPTDEPTPTPSDDSESEPTQDPDAVSVEVTIEDGEITPLGETVEAEVGQEIELVVDSDAHDEFHVHSEPEHAFQIEEGEDQRFTFSIDEPATYEMESHELGVVILKLQISE